MKESHRKGVVNHPDPESCGKPSQGGAEALTGAQAGWVSSSENGCSRAPTQSDHAEGNTIAIASTRARWARRSRRPQACLETQSWEPGDPGAARGVRTRGPEGEGDER